MILKLTFDQDWAQDAKDCAPELIAEDAIRELAAGVKYEIINYTPQSEKTHLKENLFYNPENETYTVVFNHQGFICECKSFNLERAQQFLKLIET